MKFPTRKQPKQMSPAEREALVKQLDEEAARRGPWHGSAARGAAGYTAFSQVISPLWEIIAWRAIALVAWLFPQRWPWR